jgi:hypothetical protein
MKDILTFSAALIGSYAAFMAILLLFGRYFFPFYTKEQLERMNAIVTPKQSNKRKELKRKAIEQINKLPGKIKLERATYSKLARG